MEKHVVLIACPDTKGLISKISTVFFENDLNIIVMKEFVEDNSNQFFMRAELSGILHKSKLHQALALLLPLGALLIINPKAKKAIVILVTKEHHCLSELLTKHHFDELNAKIHCVIGNYEHLKDITERFDIPYVYINHENKAKEAYETELASEINRFDPDYIILAKYMRILSPDFVRKFENKIINIHHSFLPSFIGANPYKQAYERGVKLIGATAHVVTNDLDEGPIIVQEVSNVDHSFSIQNMVQAGHETEAKVLTKALKLVLEDRVFVLGNKTIIFQ